MSEQRVALDEEGLSVEGLPMEGPAAAGDSPGARLRAAREAQKLTAQDIAARLNLDLRVITALEADRFEELRVPAYVRGYLRSYARQVGLDGDALVQAFDARSVVVAPPLHPFRSRPAAQTDTSHHGVRLAAIAVVVLVLGLAFTWWRARDAAPGEAPIVAELPPDTPMPAPTVGQAESGGSSYRYPIVDHAAGAAAEASEADGPPSLPGYEPDAPGLAGAGGPAAYTPPAEGPEAPAGATVAPPAAEASAAEAGTAPLDVAAAEGGQVSEAVADAGADVETAAADAVATADDGEAASTETGGNVSLAIGLSGQSWVEVYDANDKRLYFNMGAAGQTIATRGEGPLRVIIGNIRAARLSVAGQDVPLEPLAREGVARLQVTAAGAEPLRRPGE